MMLGWMCAALLVPQDAIDLGSRLEPFVDRAVIERLDGVELRLRRPRREGSALRFDRPWEGVFSGYPTVLRTPAEYRLYYRGRGKAANAREVTCVALSSDGISWRRPNLELFESDGAKGNNIVLRETPFAHNFTPFYDTRPGCPSDQRYKAIAGTAASGLWAFVSEDGFRWRKLCDRAVVVDEGWVFDSQNVPFWSAAEQCYVLYYRSCPDRIRAIARVTSRDFRTWSKPVMMTYSDTGSRRPADHLYTNGTQPYFRAPHIYIGLAQRFFPGKVAIAKELAAELVADPRYRVAASDAILLTTRGGSRYERTFREAFLRPGPTPRDWIARNNMPACGVVPARDGRRMYCYRISHYAQKSIHLTRYSMRLDGFASVHAGVPGGAMTTRVVRFRGERDGRAELVVNCATSAAGRVRVGLLAPGGSALRGFSIEDCRPIVGDRIESVVHWGEESSVASLVGKPIRLRIELEDADLFSIRFR